MKSRCLPDPKVKHFPPYDFWSSSFVSLVAFVVNLPAQGFSGQFK